MTQQLPLLMMSDTGPQPVQPNYYRPARLCDPDWYGRGESLTNLVGITHSKYIKHREPLLGHVTLDELMTTRYSTDVHFCCYLTPDQVRHRKKATPADIQFQVACVDLDAHAGDPPTKRDYSGLLTCCQVVDEQPNIVYSTKRGARLVYAIKTITDPLVYEQHLHALLKLWDGYCKARGEIYQADLVAKDWTRFHRAPLVVRDDKPTSSDICHYHDDLFDLTQLKPIKKPKVQFVLQPKSWSGYDSRLGWYRRQLNPGNHHSPMMRGAFYIYNNYQASSREGPLSTLKHWAMQDGMPEQEIDNIYQWVHETWSDEHKA